MRAALLALVLVTRMLEAQETLPRLVRGTVRDAAGAPIAFAVVQTTGQNRVVSDDSGRFQYRAVPRGRLTLRILRLGYEPVELRFDPPSDTALQIVMRPIPRTFDAVNVEASRVSQRLRAIGFYERMNDRHKGLGSGTFITIEDIEQRNPLRISQMLEGINGVRVFKYGAGFDQFEVRGPAQCRFTVYLNGARIGPKLTTRASIDPVRIDALVEPSATAGIEVYPRATSAPPHFQMLNGTCGVVAFWTK